MSQLENREINDRRSDELELQQALSAAVRWTILAAAALQSSRLLATPHEHERFSKLKTHSIFQKGLSLFSSIGLQFVENV
ncbi:COP9 signalosome complex subunit 4-like [Physcomitrium patens]|uniref:COP9 signalosome complex subunit 4-like n=1 Tax=Physcomitrium patens TaxID=3218 RepID=UPI003CCE2989